MKTLLKLEKVKVLTKNEQNTIFGQKQYRGCEPFEPCEFDYINCRCTE